MLLPTHQASQFYDLLAVRMDYGGSAAVISIEVLTYNFCERRVYVWRGVHYWVDNKPSVLSGHTSPQFGYAVAHEFAHRYDVFAQSVSDRCFADVVDGAFQLSDHAL